MRLNLNADLGESWGAFRMGDDARLLPLVDSANLACGMHGGDPLVMARSIAAARAAGVSIGAHPGYADLHGFGRRPMALPAEDLRALVLYQLGALSALAQAGGWPMTHMKPHGALSNQACADPALARILAETLAAHDPGLILLAPALSELAAAGQAAGLRVAAEIFADRSYEPDGQLTPRARPGAVLHGAAEAVAHVLAMVAAGGIVARDGTVLLTPFHSVCVHGDGPDAVATARALRAALVDAGHSLHPLPALL